MRPNDLNKNLTVTILRSVMHYDGPTGKFFNIKNGKQCGNLQPDGYVRIKLFGKKYLAHRLAWLFVYGDWPSDRIDHINGVRSDNRIKNIRSASDRQNSGNKKIRSDNVVKCKGVRLHESGKYQARIGIYGTTRSKHLGLFDSIESARSAYLEAAKNQYGEFAK